METSDPRAFYGRSKRARPHSYSGSDFIPIFAALLILMLLSSSRLHVVMCLKPYDLPIRLPLHRRQPHTPAVANTEDWKLEFLQSAMKESLARGEALAMAAARGGDGWTRRSMQAIEADEGYIWPVRAGGGDYVTEIQLGTPPKTEEVLMDTGSDLIWMQCKPCIRCFNQELEVFDPASSSSFVKEACTANSCNALPVHACGISSSCVYDYQYGDGSITIGDLATETLTLRSARHRVPVSVKGLRFGCGHANAAVFAEAAPGPAGILGLGRGPLSLASQISSRIDGRFSYCLVPFDSPSASVSSPLFLGYERPPHGAQYTPILVQGPSPTYYYVGLEGISVADKRLSIPESVFEYTSEGGGSIFDSGTTLTLLPPAAYKQLKQAIISQVAASPLDSPPEGLDLCYRGGSRDLLFPRVMFHFAGGANMEVPTENYMVTVDKAGTRCLVMADAGENFSIIGNLQQQNLHVFYDLQGPRIGFLPANCSSL